MYKSREIKVGTLMLGGDNPIRIQSMANADTLNTSACVEQTKKIVDAGGELVRFAVPTIKSAKNLANIKNQLILDGYNIPLVADVHFNPNIAEVAARIVDKVRINPGNYGSQQASLSKGKFNEEEYEKELIQVKEKLLPLIEICKEHNTALRVGVNHGSLSARIVDRFGNTPRGMAESAIEFLRILNAENFHNVVVSMKASNTRVMTDSTRKIVDLMQEENLNYPIHLGVTEAGEGNDGRVKSAVGIGALLHYGIGDTVRLSLTEDPEKEIPVAIKLANYFPRSKQAVSDVFDSYSLIKHLAKYKDYKFPIVVGRNSGNIINDECIDMLEDYYLMAVNPEFGLSSFQNNLLQLEKEELSIPLFVELKYTDKDYDLFILKASADLGAILLAGYAAGISIINSNIDDKDISNLILDILQSAGRRVSKTEFISCPSCARTLFDIQKVTAEVKTRLAHLPNLNIAVMGCIVNGPGEMIGADYGYVGAGNDKVWLYKNGEVAKKNIESSEAINQLIELIKENGDYAEKA